MLILNLDYEENNLYARLEGKLTKRETYKLDHYVIPFIKQNKVNNFICDCKKLKKVDVEGRYALLKTKIVLKKQKGTLILKNVKEDIKKDLIGFRMRILTK